MDISKDQYKWSIIVVWLHDVADRKYGNNGSLKLLLNEFVHSI